MRKFAPLILSVLLAILALAACSQSASAPPAEALSGCEVDVAALCPAAQPTNGAIHEVLLDMSATYDGNTRDYQIYRDVDVARGVSCYGVFVYYRQAYSTVRNIRTACVAQVKEAAPEIALLASSQQHQFYLIEEGPTRLYVTLHAEAVDIQPAPVVAE